MLCSDAETTVLGLAASRTVMRSQGQKRYSSYASIKTVELKHCDGAYSGSDREHLGRDCKDLAAGIIQVSCYICEM
jgi:hypothetical protein